MVFSCDECHKTWPEKKNQTPDVEDGDTCPDCYEEPDEKEEVRVGSKTYTYSATPTDIK